MLKYFPIVMLVFCLIFTSGCEPKNALETISVTGVVLLNGQEAEGVNVIFNPASGDGISAGGVTDKNGRFTLTSGANSIGSGALEGEFIPTFSKIKIEEREPTASPEEQMKKYGNKPPKTTYIVPKKYSDMRTCGMEPVKVEKDKKNEFRFELTGKEE